MAEGKITITILDGGDGKKEEKEKKEKTPAQLQYEKLQKLAHPLKTANSELEKSITLGGKGLAMAGWAGMIGKEVLSNAAYYAKMELNRYFTLKEDYMGQNTMSALQAYTDTTKSIMSSIGSTALQYASIGIATGNVAGVVGGAILGAVVGGVTSVAKARTETAQNIEQTNMQMNATNMQTQFSASRAGLVNGGRGTEY